MAPIAEFHPLQVPWCPLGTLKWMQRTALHITGCWRPESSVRWPSRSPGPWTRRRLCASVALALDKAPRLGAGVAYRRPVISSRIPATSALRVTTSPSRVLSRRSATDDNSSRRGASAFGESVASGREGRLFPADAGGAALGGVVVARCDALARGDLRARDERLGERAPREVPPARPAAGFCAEHEACAAASTAAAAAACAASSECRNVASPGAPGGPSHDA